jgi:hypothetical protein
MIPFSFTAEQMSSLHNAKCKLFSVNEQVFKVLSPELLKEYDDVLHMLDKLLEPVYKEEDQLDRLADAAQNKVSRKHKLRSVWSVDKRTNFTERVEPAPSSIQYINHWGPSKVSIEVTGDTWEDMWIAADRAIGFSGDTHHSFIEDFKHIGDGVYELSTGS